MAKLDLEVFENEIAALEKKVLHHKNSRNLVAFYGSSSIRLWQTMEEDLHPINVINLGFGGSSYPYCYHYFDRVFKHLTPSQIVLYAGDNDLGSGRAIIEIFNDFKRLIEAIHGMYSNIPIHVISIKPSPSRAHLLSMTSETNGLMKKYIQGTKNGRWVELFSKMLDENAQTLPNLFIEDQLHLNARGYDIWRKFVKHHLFANNQVI
ncbi:MAG: lysophospholipase L1-like esterase [Cyclobacteriaceae bacterium]|jgi:lysophospholipase L1-like esterase